MDTANRQQRRMQERARAAGRSSASGWASAAYRSSAAGGSSATGQSSEADRDRAQERQLADNLQSAVSEAWQRGWQPADLVRIVSRQLSNRHVGLTRAAIAASMQRYAPATVEPRWMSQLSELEARVWWPPDQNHLQAWAESQNADWPATSSCARDLLSLLARLPDLERLTPVPGTARATGLRAHPHRAAIDEKVLRRIRALLAKAESTTFAPEAETFTAGAQSLMARHSIDHALLAALDQGSGDEPLGRRIGIDSPYEAPKARLLAAVAGANRCRAVWTSNLGFSTAMGFPADLDAVELLFTSLLVQATSAMMQAGSKTDGYGRSRTRSFRQSFLTAYACRIGQRLSEATGRATTQAAAEPTGGNLLPVLAARNEAVDKAIAALFPSTSPLKVGSVTHHEGWLSGLTAADRAALHPTAGHLTPTPQT